MRVPQNTHVQEAKGLTTSPVKGPKKGSLGR